MIQYEVDENSKTVKCTISREHTIGDLIKQGKIKEYIPPILKSAAKVLITPVKSPKREE